MLTKIFSAAFCLFCFSAIGHAQNEIQNFKLNTAPYNNQKHLHLQFMKPLPYVLPYNNGMQIDTTKFSHCYTTNLGEVYKAGEDGMPVLIPYAKNTDYERERFLKPYRVEPFGTPSYIDPMPNPLKKQLITK